MTSTQLQEIKILTNQQLVSVFRISLMSRVTFGIDKDENEKIIAASRKELKNRKISIAKASNTKVSALSF